MRRRAERVSPGVVGLLLLALTGCRLIYVPVALTLGAVGLTGYTVYKGGEAVVTAVGDAGSATTGAVKSKQQSMVVSRGTLEVKCPYPIARIYPVAEEVFRESGLTGIKGSHDALAGKLTARNSSAELVTVKFELLGDNLTAVAILVGGGNLKQSEYLHDVIMTKLTTGDDGGTGR